MGSTLQLPLRRKLLLFLNLKIPKINELSNSSNVVPNVINPTEGGEGMSAVDFSGKNFAMMRSTCKDSRS